MPTIIPGPLLTCKQWATTPQFSCLPLQLRYFTVFPPVDGPFSMLICQKLIHIAKVLMCVCFDISLSFFRTKLYKNTGVNQQVPVERGIFQRGAKGSGPQFLKNCPKQYRITRLHTKRAMSNQKEFIFVNISLSKVSITSNLANICMSLYTGKIPTPPPLEKLSRTLMHRHTSYERFRITRFCQNKSIIARLCSKITAQISLPN